MRWSLLLPDPGRMLELLVQHGRYFLFHWWSTLSVALAASALSLLIALAASVIVVRFRRVEILLAPAVAVSQSFPLQALAPLIVVAMGIGFHTKLTVALIIAFFPIYNACVTALRSSPESLLALARTCRAGFLATTRHVRFPAAMPAILSAAKVGFTLAVLGAVVGEFIQPDRGLGHVLLIAQSSFDVDTIYLCVGMLLTQGVVVFLTLSVLEARALRTRKGETR